MAAEGSMAPVEEDAYTSYQDPEMLSRPPTSMLCHGGSSTGGQILTLDLFWYQCNCHSTSFSRILQQEVQARLLQKKGLHSEDCQGRDRRENASKEDLS